MAYITVTNTFTSGAVAASGQVNQNFTDITAGLSDGTKDVHVRDISVTSAIVTGNVTIGETTFKAWSSGFSVIQLGGNAAFFAQITQGGNDLHVLQNAWFSDGNYKYITSDYKTTRYDCSGGEHDFFAAASGTADAAITFKKIMHINETETIISTSATVNALKVDYANNKIYSEILKTTQAAAASVASVYVDLATGELYSRTLS